jgi:hypothetical protein
MTWLLDSTCYEGSQQHHNAWNLYLSKLVLFSRQIYGTIDGRLYAGNKELALESSPQLLRIDDNGFICFERNEA